ncbi:MAG TPA: hypothetical protein VNJ12_11215 [Candidatus Dormibacteraeota bacterium]|nr:hypothetical protein [Candidatus Dormibacteraeota bacterium]
MYLLPQPRTSPDPGLRWHPDPRCRARLSYLLGLRGLGQTETPPTPPAGFPSCATFLSPAALLAAITVNGAVLGNWIKGNSFQTGTYAQLLAAMQTNEILLSDDPQYVQQNACSGVNNSSAALVNTAIGGGATAANVALKFADAAQAIPIVGAIAGAAVQIYDAIFAHHAAAVAREHQVLCAAVPAGNTAIQTLIQAVQSGTIDPVTGINSLYQLWADFQATVNPVSHSNCGSPDAGCGWMAEMAAIVASLAQQWWQLVSAATSATPASSAGFTLPATAGLPGWALPVAALVALYFLS